MNTYQAVVDDSGRIILATSLKKGERVRVIIETEIESEQNRIHTKRRATELFKQMGDRMAADPSFQSLSEDEIAEEIAAYRRGE